MSKESSAKYEYQIGPQKKYSTEYTWTLHDWSLLYDSMYKKGVTSTNFDLNGICGCICKIRLSPMTPEKGLTIEFSDTHAIEAMKVTWHTGNSWSKPSYHCRPILKSNVYSMDHSLTRDSSDRSLKIDMSNSLILAIKITVVKISNAVGIPHPPALPPHTFCSFVSPPHNILANFKIMFDRKAFSDVTFVLGDRTFYAHKAVLAAQSKVFEAMFLSDMKEQNNKIEISDTCAETFERFLNYLYSGILVGLREMVEEMIVIADFYNVSDLKIRCENVMLKSISESSAIRYLILADKLDCGVLKKAALQLIRNSPTVFEEALLEEDIATMTCLKEILSKNRPEPPTDTNSSDFSAPLNFKF